MEKWKNVIIDGWIKTKYIINSKGVLKNKIDNHIIPQKNDKGYKRVTISAKINGKTQYFTLSIHRIVATAFLPNPDKLPYVNHKDENKANNNVENLEWCTEAYNVNYGSGKDKNRISQQRPITCMFGDKKATYISAHKAAELCNCSWPSISEVVRGKKKRLYGSYWRRATKDEIKALNDKYHIGDDIDFTPYKKKSNKNNKVLIFKFERK